MPTGGKNDISGSGTSKTIPYPPEHICIANIYIYGSTPPPAITRPLRSVSPMSPRLLKRGYSLFIWQLYHCNATTVQTQLDLLKCQSAAMTIWWRKRAMRYLTDVWQWIITAHFWSSNLLRQRTVLAVSRVTHSSTSAVSVPMLTTSRRMFFFHCVCILHLHFNHVLRQ